MDHVHSWLPPTRVFGSDEFIRICCCGKHVDNIEDVITPDGDITNVEQVNTLLRWIDDLASVNELQDEAHDREHYHLVIDNELAIELDIPEATCTDVIVTIINDRAGTVHTRLFDDAKSTNKYWDRLYILWTRNYGAWD